LIIWIERTKCGFRKTRELKALGKGKKIRIIPINDELVTLITQFKEAKQKEGLVSENLLVNIK